MMNRTVVRYQMLDTMPSPRYLQPRPRLHRRQRKQREWVEGTQLRGKEYWKALGLSVLWMLAMFLVWWYGGM